MEKIRKYKLSISVFVLGLTLLPFITPAIALAIGILVSLTGFSNRWLSAKSSLVLKVAIVLMGFGMSMQEVMQVSSSGVVDTAVSVLVVMLSGLLLGRMLKIEKSSTLLISAGTAICGGSAIAAVAPVLGAKNHEISFALVVVFVLNAIALFLFPYLGHYFGLSQSEFGYWAAIAIHDTSSVVGAGAAYGNEALKVATTVKLVRTLWIIPLSIVLAFVARGESSGKIKIPWFIGLFVLAILIASYLPQFSSVYGSMFLIGKKLMVVALFLIGSSISVIEAKKAGPKGFLMGILLWIIIGTSSLLFFLP